MIGPSGSNGKAGAAAGLLGPPPRTMATFAVTLVASRQPDGLQAYRFQHCPVGPGGVYGIRFPGLMGPCDGQPTLVEARRRASAQGILN